MGNRLYEHQCRGGHGESGGELEADSPSTSVKFPGQGSGAFGAAKVTPLVGGVAGPSKGVRMEPFNYTGCTVVSPEQFKVKELEELRRAKALPGRPFDYKVRYPDT